MKKQYILILYTTLYRKGGDKFERAARTLETEKKREMPEHEVICRAVESKAEFLAQINNISAIDREILELHFLGHSGLYGIMFGSTQWPEQFSPFEWKEMRIPFSANARCYFHACRTGRWFAPFISRTLGVTTFGHYGYTTVSTSKEKFKWEGRNKKAPLFIVSCPGRKSHGIMASLVKYSGLRTSVPMLEFSPSDEPIDSSYDGVADLYDEVFSDISVRRAEYQWLMAHLPLDGERSLLDLGCGNGALLEKLGGVIGTGVGVDISAGMIEKADHRCSGQPHLSFHKLNGPQIPCADNSFDAVVSMLSFRYLDWDPILHEILRVMKPGGELFIVDMVATPVQFKELPRLFTDKVRAVLLWMQQPHFFRSLRTMVHDPRWIKMLKYNPMRAEHEYRWYLESRFPGRHIEVINIGYHSRIIAFRSGPIYFKTVERLTFP